MGYSETPYCPSLHLSSTSLTMPYLLDPSRMLGDLLCVDWWKTPWSSWCLSLALISTRATAFMMLVMASAHGLMERFPIELYFTTSNQHEDEGAVLHGHGCLADEDVEARTKLPPEPLSLTSSVIGIPQFMLLLNLRTSIMGVMGTMGTELMKESTELSVSPPCDLKKRHKQNTPTGVYL